VVECLASIVSQIKEATEKDRAASTALLDTSRQISGEAAKRSEFLDATREPLSAAHALIEILELLEVPCAKSPSVASILDRTRSPPAFIVGTIDKR